MKARNGHITYLLINIPFIWWVKIGITGGSVKKRARQVDKAAPGVPIPIGVMLWPFMAKQVEGILHSFLSPISSRFYRGDGSTEWFWLPAIVPYYIVMFGNWWIWYELVSLFLR